MLHVNLDLRVREFPSSLFSDDEFDDEEGGRRRDP